MSTFKHQSDDVLQVCDLLHLPLTSQSRQAVDEGANDEDQQITLTVDPDLHQPHLISIVGVITKKKKYQRQRSQEQTTLVGSKRTRDADSSGAESGDGSNQPLGCILHVRDLQHVDIVEIRVHASRFDTLGTLQLNEVVKFSRLQGFIARSSYKVYLSWSHRTAARQVSKSVPRDAELYGSMSTTFLNDLYHASSIDRRLHRYVVGVMHISYVVLKRKCRSCKQALQLNKRRGRWIHADDQTASKYSRECAWRWQHLAPSDPAFKSRTYLGTTVRCIIDDGSGQAELFLENEVAWELLTCPTGQYQRFEDIVSNYVQELSYFSGRTANGTFATSKAEQEQEYYQNELRVFVLDAIPSLRSIVVFAQQFYKAKKQMENTSMLTFGKDVHITTKTVPQPKLEAKRVDRVHVRSELQRRLAQVRLQTK